MRHVPTALYVDTEIFKRNGLRLDTKGFSLLRSTFVPRGIRLLVPAMMERELLRHYERHAKQCGDDWEALQNAHPVLSVTSWTARSGKDLAAECLSELNAQWEKFKAHFTVEVLPIVGDLNLVVDQYFAVQPPFAEGKKAKEFPDAFILSALAQYHKIHSVNIAIVSHDGGFKAASATHPYVYHFTSLEDYVNAFKPELGREPEEPIDPLRPIVTEDLTELKGILHRGAEATPIESTRLISLLASRGENYRYFFLNATDPFWIPHLEAAGIFAQLPQVEEMPDGTRKIPDWPPIYYLEKAFDSDPDAVIRILEAIPTTSNPRILQGIVSIAAKCDRPEQVARVASKILASADNPRWAREKFIELLKKLSQW